VLVGVARASATTYGEFGAWFNLATGAVGSTFTAGTNTLAIKSVTDVGNGWYRLIVAGSVPSATSYTAYVAPRTADASATGVNNAEYFMWGAQLEAGSFATSYIPTVASQVTRSVDLASMTGTNFSSWYRADEGSLYAEYARPQPPSGTATVIATISDSAVSNRVVLQSRNAGPIGENLENHSANGTVRYAFGSLGASNTMLKAAACFSSGSSAASLNAATVVSNTGFTVPPNASQLSIGDPVAAATIRSVIVRKLAYYPKRLTNQELVGLTTV
jgi:hypothetical protein